MAITVSLPSTVTPLGRAPGTAEPVKFYSPIVADYIDPTTQDYLSLTKGMDPIDAQVLVAMKTVKGSGAAVLEEGNNLKSIRKIEPGTARRVQNDIRAAISKLVTNGDIRIVEIDTETRAGQQQVDARVDYENLRARVPGRVSIKAVITS
jgi:hypothetical protein